MNERVRFHISDVELEIVGVPREIMPGLLACWGACDVGPLPISRHVRLDIEERDDGYWVLERGEHAGGADTRANLLPKLERCIYRGIRDWHTPPRVILHAAGIAFGEVVLVLAGASGGGKSSLARALVAQGGLYLSDELVICDGPRVWGIPRAIQFDLLPLDAPRPWWLGDVDLESYPIVDDQGRDATLPVVRLPRDRVRPGPFPAQRARVVTIEHGARDALRGSSAGEALAVLHAGAFSRLDTDLGPLVGNRSMHLEWQSPDAAAALVVATLG